MSNYLMIFVTKEIQKYILRGNKLKDMIGGSELVNGLCDLFLVDCLKKLNISEKDIIINTAGFAQIVFKNQLEAEQFYKFWPFLANRFLRGDHIVQSLKVIDKSIGSTFSESHSLHLTNQSSLMTTLPDVNPLMERYPRTGKAATNWDSSEKMYVDSQSKKKREQYKQVERNTSGNKLILKIGGDPNGQNWPVSMDDIAGDKYIGIIHADGNDMGKFLIRIQLKNVHDSKDEINEILRDFAQVVESTCLKALKYAFTKCIMPAYESDKKPDKYVPLRPIVIGGDDITIIVRADLAFNFAQHYLKKFQEYSNDSLKSFQDKYDIRGLPLYFTACAGITFVKKAYPFYRAYDLSESLCEYSKSVAKRVNPDSITPSCLSFHKITESASGDYKEIRKHELTTLEGKKLWYSPYSVVEVSTKLPMISNLIDLVEMLKDDNIPHGSIRTLMQTLYSDSSKAAFDFDRIVEIANAKIKDKAVPKLGDVLRQKLVELSNNQQNPLWSENNQTPLLDAWKLYEITKKEGDENE